MRRLLGLIYILIPVLAWGMSFVSTEFLLRSMGPMMIVAIRFCLGTLVLFAILKCKKGPARLKKEHIPYFFLAGGIGITAYFYFENIGILNIGATDSVLMISTIPVVTMITDTLFYKSRFGFWNIVSVIGSCLGVALIVLNGGNSLETAASGIGYIYMFLAIVSWVVYIMSTKRLIGEYSMVDVTFYQFLFSIPFFLLFLPFEQTNWQSVGADEILNLAFLSIMASILGFYFYNKAMDYIGATTSAIFLNFMPIITMVFGYFYLNSNVTVLQLIGSLVIIVSATLSVIFTEKTQSVS